MFEDKADRRTWERQALRSYLGRQTETSVEGVSNRKTSKQREDTVTVSVHGGVSRSG